MCRECQTCLSCCMDCYGHTLSHLHRNALQDVSLQVEGAGNHVSYSVNSLKGSSRNIK